MARQKWVLCPDCAMVPLRHLYLRFRAQFKTVNLWLCPSCNIFFTISDDAKLCKLQIVPIA